MVKWKQYASQLKDELRSTTENYETQLSVMSEHLVDLNMDLNEKREAIESFNLQLSNKVKCRCFVCSSFCEWGWIPTTRYLVVGFDYVVFFYWITQYFQESRFINKLQLNIPCIYSVNTVTGAFSLWSSYVCKYVPTHFPNEAECTP